MKKNWIKGGRGHLQGKKRGSLTRRLRNNQSRKIHFRLEGNTTLSASGKTRLGGNGPFKDFLGGGGGICRVQEGNVLRQRGKPTYEN